MTETRKLAAILASDVVGYSRLAGADEEGTVARLRALRAELFDPTVAAHHGRVVKTTGDGMLIEFASVVDAVRAAIAVQSEMARRGVGIAAERQIRFRVGIHLGDVLVEGDGDLLGDGVNIAARLESIAEPGGICLSEDAWRQVRDKVDAAFTDLGERALKNIARPIHVFSVDPAKAGPEGQGSSPALGSRFHGDDDHKEGPPRLSIVVLPFANMSGDAEQEYFVDGLTEDLTTELSRMPGAFVIARNTAFTYKGKAADVKTIGHDLGVRYALEGSARKSGNRVRLSAQLIDTETGAHLWADRFDRDLIDIFDLQDSVTQELAHALDIQLVEAESRRGQAKANPDALDLVLRARAVENRGWGRETSEAALRLFERALALDPDNILAMCGAAGSLAGMVSSLWSGDRARDLARAGALAERALALAPRNSECLYVAGLVDRVAMRFDDAIAAFEAAIRINPNSAGAHSELGWANSLSGRLREALPHFAEAIRLSPRDPRLFIGYFGIGEVRFELGEYEAAIDALRRSIVLNPQFSWPHLVLAATLVALDRIDEARAALAAYLRTNPVARTIADLRANPVSRTLDDGPFYPALRQAGMPDG
jgi:TolB-like protein/class 3 adenylate cyclase